jgi:hypothetical protein
VKYHGEVPIHWLAGTVYVENSSLNLNASRIEDSVLASLLAVKAGLTSKSFPGFNSGKLHDLIKSLPLNSAELKSLATSYGYGQLMGYNYFNHLGWLPEKYMHLTPEEAVQGMCVFAASVYKQTSANRPKTVNEQFYTIWNTGQWNGKTYNKDYAYNAILASAKYLKIIQEHSK